VGHDDPRLAGIGFMGYRRSRKSTMALTADQNPDSEYRDRLRAVFLFGCLRFQRSSKWIIDVLSGPVSAWLYCHR
jgi:hypothetical protein